MIDPDAPFSAARERDIDLLVMEELACSPSFQRAFLANVGMLVPAEGVAWTAPSIMHSVLGEGGESDLVVDFEMIAPREQVRLYIENKVRAGFQPLQIERYLARADKAVAAGECDRAFVVLIAPSAYPGEVQDPRVRRIPYERMIEFLTHAAETTDHGELRARLHYRHRVLQHAIDDCHRGWQQKADKHTSDFARAYYERACQVAPSLKLEAPNPKTKASLYVYFSAALKQVPALKPPWDIMHKTKTKHHGGGAPGQEHVQVRMRGWMAHRALVEERVLPLLAPGMEIRAAGKSLAVAIPTPTVEIEKPFSTQIAEVDAGLAGALRLQQWYEANLPQLVEIAASLPPVE